MTDESGGLRPSDRELRNALRAAVPTPFAEVDWDRLHRGIMADGRAHFAAASGDALGWIEAWSTRGIPLAAGALAAAATIVTLWIAPIVRSAPDAQHPASRPVAEELMSGLPEGSRLLLNARTDVASMLLAVMLYRGEDG